MSSWSFLFRAKRLLAERGFQGGRGSGNMEDVQRNEIKYTDDGNSNITAIQAGDGQYDDRDLFV